MKGGIKNLRVVNCKVKSNSIIAIMESLNHSNLKRERCNHLTIIFELVSTLHWPFVNLIFNNIGIIYRDQTK